MIKLLKYLKPYILNIVFIVVLFLFQALIDLSLPTLMAEIVNKGVVKNNIPFIMHIGGIMLSLAFLGVICAFISGFLSSRTALGFSEKLRHVIFEKVESFSLYEFDRIGASSLIIRTTNDVLQVQRTLTIMMSMMLRAPLMCIGGIIMAFFRNAQLSLVLVSFIPVLAVLIYFVQKNAMPIFREMQHRLDTFNLVIREKLSGVRVIRAFNMTEHETRRFDRANKDLMDTALKLTGLMSSILPVLMVIMNFAMIVIVWVGGIKISHGSMNIGDILAFIQYVNLILFSLMLISFLFILIPRSEVSAARINEVLDMDISIKDPENPVSPEKKGSLEFRDVTFKYQGAEESALCNVSFYAEPGKVTGIIGGTGSGKSTLAALALRFYDVCSGAVLVDGTDVRKFSQQDLRSRIGYCPQTSFLFTGTVEENVLFGGNGDIHKALTVSQSMEFVSSMPEKEMSIISPEGKNLSGGQKQRLSIARAIARKPDIYIFDDAFSALDFKTDAVLRAALKKETSGATVVIIAQRVATVLDADRIVVLDDGIVAGIGTHKELLESCKVYREIVNSQFAPEAAS
ncbi:MAG: ABC transporter ATP-binding protein [Candidatus Goldbacteria bacterium]|nr:ABC transporter ATP-binding protein [Candidatus Goldiibacteriota bacterium]